MDVPKIFGRYQPLNVLGTGGGSRVMLVRDLLDGETRALKVLLDEAGAEGFVREYELLAGLDHPQIVKVYDFGQDASGLRYFTMEYLQGRPLSKIVSESPDIETVLRIARQLLSALTAIHARGILHADLKPHNMYVVDGEDGQQSLKLLDFGLAGQRKDKVVGQRRGTLGYMAPEWFSDKEVDFRSDLYSAGVLLFELLTGSLPINEDTPQALIQRKLREDAPDVMKLKADCPPSLAKTLSALLEREPGLRPQTAADALRLLEAKTATEGKSTIVHLASLPLVGRERLLASSRGLLESVITSNSGALQFLLAEAGGGKTRILRDLKGMLQREGHRVIDVKGTDVQGRSTLEQLLFRPVKLEADNNRALISRYETVLGTVFGDDARQALAGPVTPQQRLGILDGLSGFLIELAARQPLVLLIDDLHLADALVHDLILHIGRRIAVSPLLVFATVDNTWLDARDDYKELREHSEVTVHKLEALTRDDIHQLLKEMFGLNDAARLVQILASFSGGSPALLSEALETFVSSGAMRLDLGRWLVSEDGCQEQLAGLTGQNRTEMLLQRRLTPLGASERSVLEAAAVLGATLEADALLGLVGGASWAAESLERLVRLGYLERFSDRPGTLGFTQPRLQEYILGQLPFEHRRALHRRAGEQLLAACGPAAARPESLPDDTLELLARHFLAAGDLSAGKTFGVLAAAKARAHSGWRQAQDLYEQLIALSQQHHLVEPQDIRLALAEMHLNLGRMELAREQLEKLFQEPVEEDTHWIPLEEDGMPFRVRVALIIQSTWRQQGDPRSGLAVLDRLLPEEIGDSLLTRIFLAETRADLYSLKGDYDDAIATARGALELAGDTRSPRLLGRLINLYAVVATALHYQNKIEECFETIQKGVELGELPRVGFTASDEYHVRRSLGTLHMQAGSVYQTKGEQLKAIQATNRALPYFESVRELHYMLNCYNNNAISYYALGEWSESVEQLERTLDLAERMQAHRGIVTVASNLGYLYKDLGLLDKAAAMLERSIKVARKLNLNKAVFFPLGNLGDVRARQGNIAEAYRLYEQSLEMAKEHQAVAEIIENHRRLAELALEENKLTRARREMQEGLELARKHSLRAEEANLLSLQGTEAATRGLSDRAMSCFRQAEEVLKEQKGEIERARLKYRQGLAFVKLGFPSEAERALRQSEDLFRRLGAAWELRRTREALTRLAGDAGGSGLAFKKLQVLLDITRTLGSELELDALLSRLLDKALELTQTERGFVILLDEKGSPNFFSTRSMARDEVEQGDGAQISSTIIKRVIDEARALAITNIDQELDLRGQASIVALGLRSIMCAPIKRGDRVLGVVYVDSSKITESFYQADVSLLEALADAAAISLENAQLITSLRRKTDLMSILAHEFRSPLSASITFTQQLLREPARLNADQSEGLEAILEQGHRLARMINNILELSRMEANKVEWYMEEVLIEPVLQTAVRGLEPLAREKNVRIILKPGPKDAVIYGNQDRLIQVCTNLLGNALKFTPERGRVELSFDVLETHRPLVTRGGKPSSESWSTRTLSAGRRISDTNFLTVRFADTGPGIPLEDLERIFGKFAQTGPAHMRGQGTGLGLTIAREIISQHGGRLWAENAASGGAMFIFSLPVVVDA